MARKTEPYQRSAPISGLEKPPSEKSPGKNYNSVSPGGPRRRVINPKSPAKNIAPTLGTGTLGGSSEGMGSGVLTSDDAELHGKGTVGTVQGSLGAKLSMGMDGEAIRNSVLLGRTRVFTDAETLPTRNALRELKDLIGGAISEDEDEAADGRDRQYIRINLTRPEITTLLQTVVAAEALANAPMWTEGTVDFFKNLELILLQLAKTFRAGGKVIGALTGVSQSVDALLNAIRAFTGSTDDAEVEQDTD